MRWFETLSLERLWQSIKMFEDDLSTGYEPTQQEVDEMMAAAKCYYERLSDDQ